MFYEENLIDESLKCSICMKRFQDPVSLPCGEIVCQKCINDYIEEHLDQSNNNNSRFKCCVCDEEHSIPEKGFPRSKMASNLVQIKSKQVYKSAQIEQFKSDVNECLNEINRIKQELDNKEETIRDYFELKRQQIHLASESKINEINKIAKELLDQVDQFQNQHLESFKDYDKQKKLKADLEEAELFCNRWLDRLKLPETNDYDVEKERNELNNRLKSIHEHSLIASDFIFDSKQIHFVENQDPIESSAVGKFDITSHRLANVSVEEISGIWRKLGLYKKVLLDVNQFKTGELCSTFFRYNSTENDEDLYIFLFSLSDTYGDDLVTFVSEFYFPSKQFFNMSIISLSNGTHVLVSIFFPHLAQNYLFIISNDEGKDELAILTKREFKSSIDSHHVYVLDANKSAIDVYDFTLQKIRSIQIGEQFQYLFDPSLSIMINDDSLYAYNNCKVDTYQLSNFKLTKSFYVNLNDSPLSMHFVKDYIILRYKYYLKCVDLNDGRSFHRAVNNIDWSGNYWKMTAYDIDRFIFLNPQTEAIHISSQQ